MSSVLYGHTYSVSPLVGRSVWFDKGLGKTGMNDSREMRHLVKLKVRVVAISDDPYSVKKLVDIVHDTATEYYISPTSGRVPLQTLPKLRINNCCTFNSK